LTKIALFLLKNGYFLTKITKNLTKTKISAMIHSVDLYIGGDDLDTQEYKHKLRNLYKRYERLKQKEADLLNQIDTLRNEFQSKCKHPEKSRLGFCRDCGRMLI
jgi:coenzyme F420-reducing hydrogenase alpha subunit